MSHPAALPRRPPPMQNRLIQSRSFEFCDFTRMDVVKEQRLV